MKIFCLVFAVTVAGLAASCNTGKSFEMGDTQLDLLANFRFKSGIGHRAVVKLDLSQADIAVKN